MKKILIFSFFCLLCFTTSFAQKVKPVNYGGSVNLMEVRGRGGDAVVVLRTLGYGKNDALAQEDAEVRVIRALLYSGFSKDYPAVISMTESEAEAKSQGKLLKACPQRHTEITCCRSGAAHYRLACPGCSYGRFRIVILQCLVEVEQVASEH